MIKNYVASLILRDRPTEVDFSVEYAGDTIESARSKPKVTGVRFVDKKGGTIDFERAGWVEETKIMIAVNKENSIV